jgi:hypothetical protein
MLLMNVKASVLIPRLKTALVSSHLIIAGATLAQDSNAPVAGTAASPISVEILSPCEGAEFQAGTNITISAWVSPNATFKPGDSVRVELFAGGRSLGSRTSFWHAERRPQAKHPRDALPMWIMAAQFDSVDWEWKNPAPGDYILTAKATFANSPPAVSKPMNIAVRSLSTRTATGHE